MTGKRIATVLGIAVSILAVLSAIVGATWHFSRTNLADQLDQYEKSKDWKLPDNLRALGEVSQKLSVTLDERKELDSLRASVPKLNTDLKTAVDARTGTEKEIIGLKERLRVAAVDITALTDRLGKVVANAAKVDQAEAELTKLRARIKDLEGETFVMKDGEGRVIVPGSLSLGVTDVDNYFKRAKVTFADEVRQSPPGTTFRHEVNGTAYTVTLLEVGEKFVKFSIVTIKKPVASTKPASE